MNLAEAVLLGAVEGLTEFLPISSTGHLTIIERLLGYSVDDPDVTAFTAIIQVGAVLATLIYLRDDFRRIVFALIRGLFRSGWRADPDWRFGWAVVLGSVPIGIVGLLFQDTIQTTLRSLWFIGAALIIWSGPMFIADRVGTQHRGQTDVTWKDTLIIGTTQCLALIPGVSRCGATMTAGLLQGFSAADDISAGVGWPATLTATAVSFVVAYAAVAWLLKFIAGHSYTVFIVYRVVLGTVVLALVGSGTLAAT